MYISYKCVLRNTICQCRLQFRARFFKLLRIPRIDYKEPIPPGHVAWRPVRQPYSYSLPSPHRLFYNSSTVRNILAKNASWYTQQRQYKRKCEKSGLHIAFKALTWTLKSIYSNPSYKKCRLDRSVSDLVVVGLKVHKIENFFGSDLEFCVISFLVMLKY